MAPSADQPVSLDNLLLHLDMLWTKYKAIHLQEDHHILRSDCEALKIRFIKWTKSQAAEVRQTTVTTLTQEKEASIIPVGCWPGPVYTYPDFYIAGIWNISRAAQLLLIMLMSKVADNVADTDSLSDAASAIVNDTMASIPYHLTENLYDFVNGPKTGIEEPGRTLGGLLIMHPLYVASRVPSIPGATRDYLQRCLMWISSNMGIRHADRLAQV